MLECELNFGVPNVDLDWTCGGTVNPSCFVGHALTVLFLPLDPAAAAAELQSYDRIARELGDYDSWLVVVARSADAGLQHRPPIALDPDDKTWDKFTKLAKTKFDRADGGAFLFTRGGSLHRVWQGRGHASDVMSEVRTRA